MTLWTAITDFLLKLPPWSIVEADQKGVFLRAGKYRRSLGPGFYWKWPIYDRVRKVCSEDQIIRFKIDGVTGSDGVSWSVAGAVRYRVHNVRRAIIKVQDYDDALPVLVADAIAGYVRGTDSQRITFTKLAEAADVDMPILKDWGLELLDVWFSGVVKCHPILLIGLAPAREIMNL